MYFLTLRENFLPELEFEHMYPAVHSDALTSTQSWRPSSNPGPGKNFSQHRTY